MPAPHLLVALAPRSWGCGRLAPTWGVFFLIPGGMEETRCRAVKGHPRRTDRFQGGRLPGILGSPALEPRGPASRVNGGPSRRVPRPAPARGSLPSHPPPEQPGLSRDRAANPGLQTAFLPPLPGATHTRQGGIWAASTHGPACSPGRLAHARPGTGHRGLGETGAPCLLGPCH